ncbi:MAG: DNA alkylation repair protein [Planctomycetota bacterium]|jgi:3-methyladenine DNA glycosylase AlkD
MNPRQQVAVFRRDFAAAGSPERAEGEKRYLKSPLNFHGVTVPHIRKTARTYYRGHTDLSRADLLPLCQELWDAGFHDLRTLAIALLEQFHELLRLADHELLEHMLRQSGTWAHVDFLATRIGGSLYIRFKGMTRVIRRWSRDDDFWLRRSALLTLHDSLRAGEGDFDLFEELSQPMLEEREFFIRKAIGWVLRATSEKRPKLSEDYLRRHLSEVSGLTLREGAKRLKPATREVLIAAHKSR